tara:strand:+ start:283 stop:474 length:192 start_codon:yes stop_codon:yes gene_type:complete
MTYYNNDDVMSKLDEIANDIMNLSVRVSKLDDSIPKKNSEKNSESQSLDKVLVSTEDPLLVEM